MPKTKRGLNPAFRVFARSYREKHHSATPATEGNGDQMCRPWGKISSRSSLSTSFPPSSALAQGPKEGRSRDSQLPLSLRRDERKKPFQSSENSEPPGKSGLSRQPSTGVLQLRAKTQRPEARNRWNEITRRCRVEEVRPSFPGLDLCHCRSFAAKHSPKHGPLWKGRTWRKCDTKATYKQFPGVQISGSQTPHGKVGSNLPGSFALPPSHSGGTDT